MEVKKVVVTENIEIAKDTYKMTLKYSNARQMKPGQFVNIKIDGYMLRRPISISLVKDRNQFVIVYKVVGDGTKKLSTVASGETIDMFLH